MAGRSAAQYSYHYGSCWLLYSGDGIYNGKDAEDRRHLRFTEGTWPFAVC